MSWIACQSRKALVWSSQARSASEPVQATLQLELDLARLGGPPADLIVLPNGKDSGGITLGICGRGRLHVTHRADGQVTDLSVGLDTDFREGSLRLTCDWDLAGNRVALSAENLSSGSIRQNVAPCGLVPTYADAARVFGSRRHDALDWLALADHSQPIGPGAALAGKSLISTPLGPRPLASLRRGDLVATADHGAAAVLWQGRITTPALGALRPLRLSAPHLGMTADLVMTPQQRIAVSGSEVEYNFGEDEVLIEARHLLFPGGGAAETSSPPVVTWHGLLLERPELICANGLWVESLNLGSLARAPSIAGTTAFADLAREGVLPRHTAMARRALLGFEASALAVALSRDRAPYAA